MTMGYAPLRLEDYALIGDCSSCALVGANGSIDWLCWPRFDSPACMAALLGSDDNGRWVIAPADADATSTRSYIDGGVVLETVFTTPTGRVRLTDLMPIDAPRPSLIRIVEAIEGEVAMRSEVRLRFDYGVSVPWVSRLPGEDNAVACIAGPAMVVLRATTALAGEDMATISEFSVGEGERHIFAMSWNDSHKSPPEPLDIPHLLAHTDDFWKQWSQRCTVQDGPYAAEIRRSLLTLKAMTYAATGGIVAAPTTSLPEQLGGPRNWDYRYCWLRDAAITLFALIRGGYEDEATAWRDWLQRSIAGSADQLQIMYGLSGERQLVEWEVDWLKGYEGSAPVRVGNAAAGQLQLDVYGEVCSALHLSRVNGMPGLGDGWKLQVNVLEHLETIWQQPDEGMWEVRGGRRPFTVSKAMCWLAFDRALKDMDRFGFEGPRERWSALRDEIHATVCREGIDPDRGCFTQYFGGKGLDAGLLLLPLTGFLPPDDPRIVATIAAIEADLIEDGFVLRYRTDDGTDGLPGHEGAFLACTFWLVEVYAMSGRLDEAKALFDRLLGYGNDLGLFSEEYDTGVKRLVGNFPQAFTHVGLVSASMRLRKAMTGGSANDMHH